MRKEFDMDPSSPLARPSEVAKFMQTSVERLASDRYRGTGPRFIKHGRSVLYRWADVYAFLEENTLARTDDRPGAA